MKKLMTIALLVNLVSSLNATLQHDKNTCRYTTSPAAPNIDQNLYHQLIWACKDLLQSHADNNARLNAQYAGDCALSSSCYDLANESGKAAVEQFLQRLANPTSIRLLADLKALNFVF